MLFMRIVIRQRGGVKLFDNFLISLLSKRQKPLFVLNLFIKNHLWLRPIELIANYFILTRLKGLLLELKIFTQHKNYNFADSYNVVGDNKVRLKNYFFLSYVYKNFVKELLKYHMLFFYLFSYLLLFFSLY